MPDITESDRLEAKRVLEEFLAAGQRKDLPAMRACLTAESQESIDAEGGPQGVRYELTEPQPEGEGLTFGIRAFAADAPAGSPPAFEMPALMLRENGAWKFDVKTSQERMMASLSGAMEQMAGAIGDVMQGAGDALAAGLHEAFGDGGEGSAAGEAGGSAAQNWDDAIMTPQPDEFFELAKLETMPKTQAAVSSAVGSPVQAQAAFPDLLRGFGEDQRDVLVNWFEDQLFAGWGTMLAEAAAKIPLRDRLRALRIEGVYRAADHALLMDGSDLVYRMVLPNNDGFYQDVEIQALLPGVLSQLPDKIEIEAAGHRLLPGDNDYPDAELYRDRIAARFMKRISTLAGHHIALEADWYDICRATNAGRALATWGFNRILGGIGIARLDPALSEAIERLKTIRIVINSDVTRRYVKYESGTLEVGLDYYYGDQPGPTESEVAGALAGNAVE